MASPRGGRGRLPASAPDRRIFLAENCGRAFPVRIAHISNPRLPPRCEPLLDSFEALTAYVEAEQQLLGGAGPDPDDAVSQAIRGRELPTSSRTGATHPDGIGQKDPKPPHSAR